MQFFITSAPAAGFPSVWRAGRPWPKKGLLVEVLDPTPESAWLTKKDDQGKDYKEDPNAADPKEQPNGGPLVIGRKTWESLKQDPRIFARPAGDIEDIAAASVALAEARVHLDSANAENVNLRETVRGLQAELDGAKGLLESSTAHLETANAEIAALKEKLAELPAADAPKATTPEPEHKGSKRK